MKKILFFVFILFLGSVFFRDASAQYEHFPELRYEMCGGSQTLFNRLYRDCVDREYILVEMKNGAVQGFPLEETQSSFEEEDCTKNNGNYKAFVRDQILKIEGLSFSENEYEGAWSDTLLDYDEDPCPSGSVDCRAKIFNEFIQANYNDEINKNHDELKDRALNTIIQQLIKERKMTEISRLDFEMRGLSDSKRKQKLEEEKNAWNRVDPAGYTTGMSEQIGSVTKQLTSCDGLFETVNKNQKIVREILDLLKQDRTALWEDYIKDTGDMGNYKNYIQRDVDVKVWETFSDGLQQGKNMAHKTIKKTFGRCLQQAEQSESERILEYMGEQTKFYNITSRLTVGQEHKLTLMDDDTATGQRGFLGKLIRLMAQITGTLAMLLLLAGAIVMIIARGDDSLLSMGKNMVIYALAGAVLIFLSYIIVQFVISLLFFVG